MAVSTEEVLKIQQRLAEVDPSIMELDPSNPDDVTTILLAGLVLAAAEKGANLTISSEDEDGRTEAFSIQSMGEGTDGKPVVAVGVGSSDGKLSPEGAELAAEVRRLSGE